MSHQQSFEEWLEQSVAMYEKYGHILSDRIRELVKKRDEIRQLQKDHPEFFPSYTGKTL